LGHLKGDTRTPSKANCIVKEGLPTRDFKDSIWNAVFQARGGRNREYLKRTGGLKSSEIDRKRNANNKPNPQVGEAKRWHKKGLIQKCYFRSDGVCYRASGGRGRRGTHLYQIALCCGLGKRS